MQNKEMSPEARQARNEYYRRWRAEHKDSVKASNRKYWENRFKRSKEHRDGSQEAGQTDE